jgi:hypothetical protein
METRKLNNYRNGDWGFYEVHNIPNNAIRIKDTGKSFTWAVGEASNHEHQLHVQDIENMTWYKMPDGGYYLEVKEEATATHPEHSMKTDLKIAPGIYHVRQHREKDWFSGAVRRVID